MSQNKQENALVSYIKALFFKAVKAQATKALIGFGLKLTGPVGWAASIAISKLSKVLWKVIYKLGLKVETKIEVKKELKDYEEQINKPDATPEDIKKSGKDFITK